MAEDVASQLRSNKKYAGIAVVVILIVLAAFVLMQTGIEVGVPTEEEYTGVENVTLTTRDGWEIAGTHYEGSEKGVVLLHMLNQREGRFVWGDFPEKLQDKGYSVMTIDLRGNAQSQSKVNSSETFYWRDTFESDFGGDESRVTGFEKMRYDVEAAVDYLEERSNITRLGIVGAEIGANVGAHYTSIGSSDTLILLSPGLGNLFWKGVPVIGPVQNYENPVLFIASNDTEYSYQSTDLLYGDSPSETKEFIRLKDSGRGTRMLNETLEQEMIAWLDDNL
ncbi:MAG: alpha/beta hydrolase [Candidatus Aenigmatarchaeota archaeon]